MKKFAKIAAIAAAAIALTACGQRVEVGPNQVGKVMTTTGYADGIWETSTRRLAACMPWEACQKLVTMNVGDFPVAETIEMMNPKSKMKMVFTYTSVLHINPKHVDAMYGRAQPDPVEGKDYLMNITAKRLYETYARPIVLTEVREHMSQYSIEEIMSNLEGVNAELNKQIAKSLAEKTPMLSRGIGGLTNPQYPKVIVDAQENAAQRREQIAQEEAQLEVSKVQLERELQEQKARRKVEVEKASSDAQVNQILAASITPGYIQYRQLEVLDKMAASDNKVFVPMGALNSIAVQQQIGK